GRAAFRATRVHDRVRVLLRVLGRCANRVTSVVDLDGPERHGLDRSYPTLFDQFQHGGEREGLRGPISRAHEREEQALQPCAHTDRKSTRLNSSHVKISYAVFCLKKKIIQ